MKQACVLPAERGQVGWEHDRLNMLQEEVRPSNETVEQSVEGHFVDLLERRELAHAWVDEQDVDLAVPATQLIDRELRCVSAYRVRDDRPDIACLIPSCLGGAL